MIENTLFHVQNTIAVDDQKAKHEEYMLKKTCNSQERLDDKENKSMVGCFDLQNVILLPHTYASCFFLQDKINIYILNAHICKEMEGYWAIWHRTMCGWSGNDIASIVIRLF